MSSGTKVVYPAPPPTQNTLTAQQRSQLLKSTKKLERLLGITPHLLDGSNPVVVSLPFEGGHKRSQSDGKNSIMSEMSYRSSSESSTSTSSRSSLESLSSIDSSPSSTSSMDDDKAASKKKFGRRPPCLRLKTPSSRPSLDTIPGSPSPYANGSSADDKYTIAPPPIRPMSTASEAPEFTIPSEGSQRLAKMERLRRKLGDGVPVEMVFPPDVKVYPMVDSSPSSRGSTPSPQPPQMLRIHYTQTTSISRSSVASSMVLDSISETPDERVAAYRENAQRRHASNAGKRKGLKGTGFMDESYLNL